MITIDVERFDSDDVILTYESTVIPRINEKVYFLHYGLFLVEDVMYQISDENKGDNRLMEVTIKVKEVNVSEWADYR